MVAIAELHWDSFIFGQLLEQWPSLLPDAAAAQAKACIRGWLGPGQGDNGAHVLLRLESEQLFEIKGDGRVQHGLVRTG